MSAEQTMNLMTGIAAMYTLAYIAKDNKDLLAKVEEGWRAVGVIIDDSVEVEIEIVKLHKLIAELKEKTK
jgi:ABC-type enterochelin transport system substrate-binding protein